MDTVQRFFRHLHTVNRHRFLVMKMCFSCGMYKQGLMHDLSKYSPTEFIPSVRYYQGNRSPISKEKEVRQGREGKVPSESNFSRHQGKSCDGHRLEAVFEGVEYSTGVPCVFTG